MAVPYPRPYALAVALLVCFGAGSLYGWSGYLPAVREAFDTGYGPVSRVFSIAIAAFTLGVLAAPRLGSGWPPVQRIGVAAAFAGGALILAAASPTLPLFELGYGGLFGLAVGVIYSQVLALASQVRHAGLMVPVAVAAFGLGGVVFGPLAAVLGARGWLLWSMAPVLLVLLPGAVLGLIGGGQNGAQVVAAPDAGSILPGRRCRLLALWGIFALGSASGLVVLGFAAQIMAEAAQGLAAPSLAIALVAVGNTLGRLAAGPAGRIVAPETGLVAATVLIAGAVMGFLLVSSVATLLSALFAVALGYGHLAATMPLAVRVAVPGPRFGHAFGWVFTGWGLAGLAGPWAAGALRDATGTFDAVLFACLCAAGLAGALAVTVRLR